MSIGSKRDLFCTHHPRSWLGAWAWDDVVSALRDDGHDVTALTLPGLESADADRSTITLADHVSAIGEAVTSAGRPVVLAVHSGAGLAGYAASDRIPDQVAAMVYVDSGRGTGASEPDFDGAEKPMPWDELKEGENLDGLTEGQLEAFRRRAVPEPGGVLREAPQLTNDARLDVPSTGHLQGIHVRRVQGRGRGGLRVARGFKELRDITWVDLPTSHWPMWSRPKDLAAVIADVARSASSG
jgi:pimeloyl-ACP methyl ester carboxylesterase